MKHDRMACDVCGETSLVLRGATRPCRMTPGCPGRHQPATMHRLSEISDAPLHRVDDGPTARIAAKQQTPRRLNETRLRVLAALEQIGPATDHVIADHADMILSSAAKRRGDLTKLGLVEEAGRSVAPSGTPATTWRITSAGRSVLAEVRGVA